MLSPRCGSDNIMSRLTAPVNVTQCHSHHELLYADVDVDCRLKSWNRKKAITHRMNMAFVLSCHAVLCAMR